MLTLGTVVLGTTKGDIHEIGKTLVGTLLTAHGFKVHDLGVDVASDVFVANILKTGADVVGISAIIVNVVKVREMCRMIRQLSPGSTIVRIARSTPSLTPTVTSISDFGS